LSYQAELRGQIPQAIDLMRRTAGEATTPAQIAFARSHEGLLALGRHDLAGAQAAYRAGTAVAPTDTALIFLGARIAWATGDRDLAVRRYADLVARRPSPVYAAAQAEALGASGDTGAAAAALDLVRASQRLAATAGVAPDGSDVLFEADHGDPSRSVALGARVWKRSPSVGAADAYGWALHVAGRDREALRYADRAFSLGGRPAPMLAHRGIIRAALGMPARAARRPPAGTRRFGDSHLRTGYSDRLERTHEARRRPWRGGPAGRAGLVLGAGGTAAPRSAICGNTYDGIVGATGTQ
jgi:hypothetical protein